MPALLSDAYGLNFAENMQDTKFGPKRKSKQNLPAALGAVAASEDSVAPVPSETPNPAVYARNSWGEKDGNYEIHITIDRQDCHLLCLFIGVFTLSVLFNSNKKGPSSTSS